MQVGYAPFALARALISPSVPLVGKALSKVTHSAWLTALVMAKTTALPDHLIP